MSTVPSLDINFQTAMSDTERRDLMQKIAKISGVLGVAFNQLGTAVRVTYTGNDEVPAQISAVGAKALKISRSRV